MNVSGWRDEPAPLPSPLATRLLRWISEATPAPQESSDELVARLAQAFCDLCDAYSVTLWLRTGANQLQLAARAGEFDGEIEVQTVELPPDSWPDDLFFIVEGEGEKRDLASQLGLLSEVIAAPSLLLPLGDEGIVLLWLESEDGLLSDDWKPVLEMTGMQAGTFLTMTTRAERLNRSFRQFAETLAAAADGRETGREGYASGVAYYAGLTARQMGLDEDESQKIEFAALLHGLGRLSVPEAVLQKNSPLSSEELEQIGRAHV